MVDSIYIYAMVSMGTIAAVLAGGLGIASKFFQIEEDERVGKIEEVLPGADCGACGFGGCSAFAEAVVNGEVEANGCPVGGKETAQKIADIMGLETKEQEEKQTAVVLCRGNSAHTTSRGKYQGIETCQACETINAGEKACRFGCLSFGDCVAVCPFAAIEMGAEGLPEINPEKCTACGKCVVACPRDIIILAPLSGKNHIRCVSKDPGAEVRKICEVGCIACGLCVQECPVEAIEIENNRAVLDYKKCINCGLCSLKCPTGTIEFKGKIIEDIEITESCVGCTRCASECPQEAISGEVRQQHGINSEECINCGLCFQICQVDGAIEVSHREEKID